MQSINFGILLFTLALFISPALAAEVAVIPPDCTVTRGQTFDLDISIDPQDAPVTGSQLDIVFDPSLIRVNSITEGDFFRHNGADTHFNSGTLNNTAGIITNISAMIPGGTNVSTPGSFITLNITAIATATGTGSSGISGIELCNVEISGPGGAPVDCDVYNGSIYIKKKSRLSWFRLA